MSTTTSIGDPIADSDECQPELTGAEAVAAILEQHGVEIAFAYAGTSELALCHGIDRAAHLSLINGRGDKESVFMAAGASLLKPNKGTAIVHGARGLTNATGAIANARRNEIGFLVIVGLPSTGSARFLPPHAEQDLIASIGNFTDWSWAAPAVPCDPQARRRAADEFVTQLRAALASSALSPTRPSMFGIPQDVADARWIPRSALRAPWHRPSPAKAADIIVERAVDMICKASRPLFLVDDYALRHPDLPDALDQLSELAGAPVLQLRYRRGPMLFERLREEEVGNFLGWFNPFSAAHNDLIEDCDLFITIEDRNIYRRIAGNLPDCRKIAISSDASKVLKNEYLEAQDILLEGDVAEILRSMIGKLSNRDFPRKAWFSRPGSGAARATPEPAGQDVERMRTTIARTVARTLDGWQRSVLVDDSQMFGGLLAERYELLPPDLRVFGDHGGFVGGGLATATGLAASDPSLRVLCTLGDQGFTNSFQGLVSAVEDNVRIVILVCNNGGAVSLEKQAAASVPGWSARAGHRYLGNVSGFSYRRVAEALGVASWLVEIPSLDANALHRSTAKLRQALAGADAASGPALIELKLPADPDVWRGIWITQGFDERTKEKARE
jgi:acetolactate synthase I/II/III large subunit